MRTRAWSGCSPEDATFRDSLRHVAEAKAAIGALSQGQDTATHGAALRFRFSNT